MKKIVSFFFVLSFTVQAQKTSPLILSFKQTFEDEKKAVQSSPYSLANGTVVQFETIKFYISYIQLLNNNEVVFSEKNSFHLIDASDINSLYISLPAPEDLKYTHVQFNLGIDSLTNVSGAYGGALDPTKGMYWTWQSGYINFKLEGTCSICPGPKKEFQFHVGGYQSPFNTLRKINLEIDNKDNVGILLDVKQFLEELNLSKLNHIMSPGKQAVEVSAILAKAFKINTP